MIIRHILIISIFNVISFGCGGDGSDPFEMDIPEFTEQADITKVEISGSANNYTFNVTISSPDTGCNQYADFWEVVSEDGDLLYRRILLHSHVNEQPFTRSGGPVDIPANQVVWVRGHMNTSGYGGISFKGSAASGFEASLPIEGFASELALTEPLPDDCAF